MKEKILILEDEIGIRSFVSINLKREGYEIIEAGTGAEAIEKINENKDLFRGSGNFSSDDAKELARLKKENRDLKDAVEILKKAMVKMEVI